MFATKLLAIIILADVGALSGVCNNIFANNYIDVGALSPDGHGW